jgi:hypothetical protein
VSDGCEVDHQFGYWFEVIEPPRSACIVSGDGVGEEVFRHDPVLGVRDEPPRSLARENVEDDI